jgi:hypothetical protein
MVENGQKWLNLFKAEIKMLSKIDFSYCLNKTLETKSYIILNLWEKCLEENKNYKKCLILIAASSKKNSNNNNQRKI